MSEQPWSPSAPAGRAAERSGLGLVLVVDDDPLTLGVVADTLEDEGYEAVRAPHGAAALDLLASRRQSGAPLPDLILLDMRMPIMDGWAFAEAYRRTPGRHAPIVVMTAAHDAADRAAQVRADAMLPKPFDLDELMALVERLLRRGCAVDGQARGD